MLVLLALGALFLFIGQQDDIGTGGYTASQAMLFVGAQPAELPVPAAAGRRADRRAARARQPRARQRARGDARLRRHDRAVLPAGSAWPGFILAVLMVGLGEFVAPPLEKYARQLKVFSKYSEFSFAGKPRHLGARRRHDHQRRAAVGRIARYGGVQVFRFDAERRLLSVGRAESASVDDEQAAGGSRDSPRRASRTAARRPERADMQQVTLVAVGRLPRARGGRAGNHGPARPARLHRATCSATISTRTPFEIALAGRASRASWRCCWS